MRNACESLTFVSRAQRPPSQSDEYNEECNKHCGEHALDPSLTYAAKMPRTTFNADRVSVNATSQRKGLTSHSKSLQFHWVWTRFEVPLLVSSPVLGTNRSWRADTKRRSGIDMAYVTTMLSAWISNWVFYLFWRIRTKSPPSCILCTIIL